MPRGTSLLSAADASAPSLCARVLTVLEEAPAPAAKRRQHTLHTALAGGLSLSEQQQVAAAGSSSAFAPGHEPPHLPAAQPPRRLRFRRIETLPVSEVRPP